MIKIIDGKRYNTATAEKLYHYTNGQFSNDFNYRSTTLYKTQNGALFLHHFGGPLTDMATQVCNNGRGWGERIRPVDEDEAYEFLEPHSEDPDVQAVINAMFSDRVVDA